MLTTITAYVIADIHSPDSFEMPELQPSEVDVVFTLGDISEDTLDYISYMARFVESFGVPGNHDPADPLGLINIHGQAVKFRGIRIGGFGGSRKYKNKPNHYTEEEVAQIVRRMPAVDLFISHAPPLGVSVPEDLAHQGFKAFDQYIHKHKPKYWLHGHCHRNATLQVDQTTVIGVFNKHTLDLRFEL